MVCHRHALNRRRFLSALGTSAAAFAAPRALFADSPSASSRPLFHRETVNILPFPFDAVRLTAGPLLAAQESNRAVLEALPVDRLVLNFRQNAGLSSSAQPLGGWEKPDCELRGHFTGHFLSACAQLYAATGNAAVKAKGDEIVAELAKCQAALPSGYLSAFPLEFLDRLQRREPVWAPFYTIHKIMAGLYDMHTLAGNQQALTVLLKMADWSANWTAQFPREHMQQILRTEYGGMNEVLYNLYGLTSEWKYLVAGDAFAKDTFFNPLAVRQDALKGLHVNTHIPQVIGACRRYEMTGDPRFRQIAQFFYETVTESRCYVTGGTSNNEAWQVDPGNLSEEWVQATDTAECCCMYNMMKLTRNLYQWSGDPRFFDYYERVLLNHRLGTIDLPTGATMYYLSHTPGAWRTFSTAYDSFWCCTGTGVEEYSKLNNSIYFHDDHGLYVNLFAASELNWKDKGLVVTQETAFPKGSRVRLKFEAPAPVPMDVRVRIPAWAHGAAAALNGEKLVAIASPGSYLTFSRSWKTGDEITLDLPMRLRTEAMPDKASIQAVLYGPLVLAADLGGAAPAHDQVFGPMGPRIPNRGERAPEVKAVLNDQGAAWVEQTGPASFMTKGQASALPLKPLEDITRERYSIYWRLT